MKSIWKKLGTAAFWVSWPLLYIYLRRGTRTRVLVISGEDILVVKSWLGTNRWSLPGGGLHRGEEPLRGVLRELQEETGLTLPSASLKPLYEATYRQNGLRFKYRCYVAELPDKPSLTPQRIEVASATWIHKDRLTPDNAGQDVITAVNNRFAA